MLLGLRGSLGLEVEVGEEMADRVYMNNRRKYQRPQALLFSQYPGEIENGLFFLMSCLGVSFLLWM